MGNLPVGIVDAHAHVDDDDQVGSWKWEGGKSTGGIVDAHADDQVGNLPVGCSSLADTYSPMTEMTDLSMDRWEFPTQWEILK